jgi:ADP-heptose:LPS heptosyltransferase
VKKPRILVIKLAALGDMIQAFAAMARIRAAHPDAHITLLTTPPFAALAKASPYVDRVETDGRSGRAGATLAMLWRLRRAHYERVYDLQTSDRSSSYFQALRPFPPEWSGIARGCSHPHNNPDRDRMHTLERQADQLRFAGIWPDAPSAAGGAPPPDLSWMLADETADRRPEHFGLASPYALLVPGASPERPGKRWPVENYAALAARLAALGLDVGVVGGRGEADLAAAILAAAPAAKDLTGRTELLQLAGLGARASLAVGNDTGPMHLIAAAGAPSLALFSAESDPALCAPRGRKVEVLRAPRLNELAAETVERAAEALFRASTVSGSA